MCYVNAFLGSFCYTNCDALFGSRVRPLVFDLLERPIKTDLELKTTEFEQSSSYCKFCAFSVDKN